MDLSPLQRLARRAREASDEAATPDEIVAEARRRALAGWSGKRPRSRRRAAFVLALAAPLVALFVAFFATRRPALTYVVGSSASPGSIGAWIAAEEGGTEVRFSEGTLLALAAGARARVTRADAEGASLLLERGSARARVVHAGPKTAWSVFAGPFEVAVVGTEFDVAWDPGREVLDLGMIEGRVVVKGPLCGEGRALVRGEVFRVEVREQRSEVRVVSAAKTDDAKAVRPAEPTPTAAPVLNETPAEALKKPALSAEEKPKATTEEDGTKRSWRALAAAGRHKEAMQAVDAEGFENVLASSSANVLLELADAARFAGQYARSKAALLRARGLGARGRSAFLLGKIAADHEGAPAEAVTWFERYLAESGAGGLGEQALGRIVELERRLGRGASARAAAERYLARYPEGAYAPVARAALAP